MRVTRKSIFSDEVSSREMNITEEQYKRWKDTGLPVQAAFPQLSADDREFLLTGMTPEEFERVTRPPYGTLQ